MLGPELPALRVSPRDTTRRSRDTQIAAHLVPALLYTLLSTWPRAPKEPTIKARSCSVRGLDLLKLGICGWRARRDSNPQPSDP